MEHATSGLMVKRSGRLPVPGAELYYETEGSGEAVVLVHGFTLDTRMWDDQVPELRDVASVVRYDARGFGRSSGPAPAVPYSHSGDQDDPHSPLIPRPFSALEDVAVPTTVVVGELDVPCFLTMATVLADRIPGARKITVPGVGHMVNMEAPHVVNAVLREAVTTVG
ncbi:MAG TPA: alpha/beta fold hydrolase [Candidatus Dormibacteraeota bacterium]|jgi:pimeloyl-ACP methyl ester carboxylesterase